MRGGRKINTVDVSVIVPTFNRASSVQRLLASLNACVNSITAELLIVDNDSTDNTASVLAQATRECTKFSLRILREERRGKANALNRGLRSAQGKIFLIVDDDVVVHPQCLIQHAESYRVTSFDAMQGRVLPGVDVDGKTADPKRLREYNIPIIDYGREDVAKRVREITGGAGVPVVFDGVGKSTFASSLDSLERRGLMVCFGTASGTIPPFDPQILAMKGSLFLTRPALADYIADPAEKAALAAEVFDHVAAGRIRIEINQRYALQDAAQAHRDLESRRTTGKLLLVP